MEAAWTLIYLLLAVGLTVEAFFALRRKRVLPSTQLPFAIGLGGLGVVTVLSKTVGSGAGSLRVVAGLTVLITFLACVGIDLLNRRTAGNRTPT